MCKLRTYVREHKPTIVQKLFLLVALVTLGALGALVWFRYDFPLPADQALRIKYLEQYVHLVQVIAAGVIIALIGMIIPQMLAEARDRFERYKESRQAYSRAKTAVIYLPDQVASMDREKAFLLVEKVHRELHLAETFKEDLEGYLKWFAKPDLWILYNYWQIVAVAEVLRNFDWSIMKNRHILRDRLQKTLDVVYCRFGKRGENIGDENWNIEDGTRFEKEDELEKMILERVRSFRNDDLIRKA